MKQQGSRAFSLMEVMIVLIILGLLASLVVPRVRNHLEKSKYRTSKLNLQTVAKAMETYYVENDQYPVFSRWEEISSANSPLLEYLNEVPAKDKWNRTYEGRSTASSYIMSGQGMPGAEDRYPPYHFVTGAVEQSGALPTTPGGPVPAGDATDEFPEP